MATKELKPKLSHSKDWYAAQLRDNVCVVVFEKRDGSERTMICTTQKDIIDGFGGTNHATTRTVTVPDYQVRVFDIQKKEWRSFNIDTVISFNVVEETV